jgi:hypothetical protein
MKKGKCMSCGTEIYGIGYCHTCADLVYKKRDEEFPFIVRFGDDFEEFATKKEADSFCDVLHRAYVERKK